jgi:hypothetical protein
MKRLYDRTSWLRVAGISAGEDPKEEWFEVGVLEE